jgi:elongation factor Ts
MMSIKERVIEAYVHHGRIAVLVELSLDDLFTAQTPQFKELAKDLAMHIAAAEPADVESLLAQPYVKDMTTTVGQLLSVMSHELHEHIAVTRFVRWDTDFRPSKPEPMPPDRPAVAVRLGRMK